MEGNELIKSARFLVLKMFPVLESLLHHRPLSLSQSMEIGHAPVLANFNPTNGLCAHNVSLLGCLSRQAHSKCTPPPSPSRSKVNRPKHWRACETRVVKSSWAKRGNGALFRGAAAATNSIPTQKSLASIWPAWNIPPPRPPPTHRPFVLCGAQICQGIHTRRWHWPSHPHWLDAFCRAKCPQMDSARDVQTHRC